MVTDDRRIQELNRQYRGLDKPTDVLSFSQEEGELMPSNPDIPRLLGDVVVSLETVGRQAERNRVALERELAWVICHGVLHLLGYDHQSPPDFDRMRALEEKVLQQVGFAS